VIELLVQHFCQGSGSDGADAGDEEDESEAGTVAIRWL